MLLEDKPQIIFNQFPSLFGPSYGHLAAPVSVDFMKKYPTLTPPNQKKVNATTFRAQYGLQDAIFEL